MNALIALAVVFTHPGFAQEARPENLALRAKVSASSEFAQQHRAQLACDGVIPEMLDHADAGKAWAVNGARGNQGARFILEWPEPVTVAEVIYYGRVSWMLEEAWRSCEVRVDEAAEPVARADFEMNAGPQRIPIPVQQVRRIALDFVGSFGGANPGAAEIEVYPASPPDEALPKLKRMPHNLAPQARISATSEHSAGYVAKLVADGNIPEPFLGNDAGFSWATNGPECKGTAEISFEWDKPVTVAEVAYWGRTAFGIEECFKDYELRLDGEAEVVASGSFRLGSGPQEIALVPPRQVRRLALRFLNSYGGANPGAAEIQILDGPAPEGWLPRFKRDGWDPPTESPELAQEVSADGLGFDRLLVIERRELNPSHVYTACCEGFQPGGGLYVLDLEGDGVAGPVRWTARTPATQEGLRKLVDSADGQILDCDVSFDGTEVLFSWRQTGRDTYHLYRINADGTGLTQLTQGRWHDYNACWLPDGGIAFISTRARVFAMCFVTPSGVLYRMDRDGGNVEQLSANYVNDFTPSVLPDGRILYSRWEYVDKPAIPIQSLWTINPDGTGVSVFFGNRVLSPATFVEARPIPGTTDVMCTLTSHNGPIRGAVGVVNRAEGVNAQAAIRNLTPGIDVGRVDEGSGNSVNGAYESPFPLDAERFLVSGKGNVYVGDAGGRWAKLLERRPPLGWYNPMPLRARPTPPVVTSTKPEDAPEMATVYLLDVYQGLEPTVKRGEVRRLAVVQEMAKDLRTDVMGFGFQRPVISCGATYAAKTVLGYVPVGEDGSACFRVPSGKPVYFEALDENGQALQRMRSFAHFMPGETRSCLGCHEPRMETPALRRNACSVKDPDDLRPPEWGEGAFDYPRVVQPVLDRYCVSCHSGVRPAKGIDLTGGATDWFSVSYDTLTRGYVSWIDTRNGCEQNILQVEPKAWGSPASKLARLILAGHPGHGGKARVQLDPVSRDRLMAWMDLNVPYYSTYEMAYPNAEGGRRIVPEGLDAKLSEVAARRCVGCHAGGVPSCGYVRLTEPELNDFLAAPLAKEAGGRQSCGEAVFADKGDADYQALLKLFEPVRERLAQRPRMDMPGAVPAEANRSCE